MMAAAVLRPVIVGRFGVSLAWKFYIENCKMTSFFITTHYNWTIKSSRWSGDAKSRDICELKVHRKGVHNNFYQRILLNNTAIVWLLRPVPLLLAFSPFGLKCAVKFKWNGTISQDIYHDIYKHFNIPYLTSAIQFNSQHLSKASRQLW